MFWLDDKIKTDWLTSRGWQKKGNDWIQPVIHFAHSLDSAVFAEMSLDLIKAEMEKERIS
jgi:hypothetical protein